MDPFCPAQKTSCKPPSVENARHHPCLTRRQFAVRGLGGGLQRKSTRSKVQISAVTRSFSAVQVQKLSIPATQCTLALLIAQCTQFALQCNRWIATGLGTQNLLRNTLARKSAKLNPVKRSAANILSDLFILAPRYVHCPLCTVHCALQQIWTERLSWQMVKVVESCRQPFCLTPFSLPLVCRVTPCYLAHKLAYTIDHNQSINHYGRKILENDNQRNLI